MNDTPGQYRFINLEKGMVTANLADQLNRLYQQLERMPTAKPSTRKTINQHDILHVMAANSVIVVAQIGFEIVSMGTVSEVARLGNRLCEIHDVITDRKHRGCGLAREVMKRLIGEAQHKFKADWVDLTSHPSRIEANHLYQSLNFGIHHTNLYRLKIVR